MIPYRTRMLLRKLGIAALVLSLVTALVLLCWFLWLNRYVIYTRAGALLDFNLNPQLAAGEPAQPEVPSTEVDIYYNEGENMILPDSAELTQISAVGITEQMLENSFDAVSEYLFGLPANTPIMLDMKNIKGEFFYPTELGKNDSAIDPQKVSQLVAELTKTNRYLIARMPALRDYWFGLQNVNSGIFNPNQMSLWMDKDNCYWLNPKAQGTLTYLLQIVTQLREMGFDEVVFTDFEVPNANIYFEGDKVQAINDFAQTLVKACATDGFAVSFQRDMQDFVLPDGRSRLYLNNVAASEAAGIVEETNISDPASRLVFLTELMDTRFDEFSVLRPAPISD